MAKTIIAKRIIINQGGDALLQYQVNIDGAVSNVFNTVSIKAALTDSTISSLFETAIASANQSEGITI